MTETWQTLIKKNFEEAASNYSVQAKLQKRFAWLLAQECAKQPIPKGIWADLGTGTGFLAEALEACNPNQSVIRIDNSAEMLARHNPKKSSQLWDLNLGLPAWSSRPTLIASSFALHWLQNPQSRLAEWFQALAPGGWLAIAVPIQGSFPEWEKAANRARVHCTALPLPSKKSLLKAVSPAPIKFQTSQRFTQSDQKVHNLLKPIVNTGAHASPYKPLNVGSWRRLQQAWPRSKTDQCLKLTWLIQLLLVQR